jgi:hypothetical protein
VIVHPVDDAVAQTSLTLDFDGDPILFRGHTDDVLAERAVHLENK